MPASSSPPCPSFFGPDFLSSYFHAPPPLPVVEILTIFPKPIYFTRLLPSLGSTRSRICFFPLAPGVAVLAWGQVRRSQLGEAPRTHLLCCLEHRARNLGRAPSVSIHVPAQVAASRGPPKERPDFSFKEAAQRQNEPQGAKSEGPDPKLASWPEVGCSHTHTREHTAPRLLPGSEIRGGGPLCRRHMVQLSVTRWDLGSAICLERPTR